MRRRVAEARVGRLATTTAEDRPHVVPCCFALEHDVLCTAVDDVKAKATRALRRLDNVRRHPEVALLVDHYRDDWSALWWVRVDGTARVTDGASPEGRAALARLAAKYEQYRDRPPPGPVVLIEATAWTAWP
jgi:PPOX class probable F420-dependent enzyme